jgi:hypothetical protein
VTFVQVVTAGVIYWRASGGYGPGCIQDLGGKMATQPSMQNEELVPIFDSEQESEAMIVRGLLESAGIDAIITGLDAPQDVLPGVGGVVVRVAPDRAEEARQIIADYRTEGDSIEGELSSETGDLSDSDEM